MNKKARTFYLLGGLFMVGYFAFTTYTSILVFKLEERIEEFYQKDFVNVRVVSDLLVRDIEKVYGERLPPVELNIRLSEYSDTGIQFDSKTLRLFLPPKVISFDDKQKRAYLAHEFGHYVLGHIDKQNLNNYSSFGTGNLMRDIQADSFALKFSNVEDLSLVINKLVWDENERKTRLTALMVG